MVRETLDWLIDHWRLWGGVAILGAAGATMKWLYEIPQLRRDAKKRNTAVRLKVEQHQLVAICD
jgi:hypothetical protein